jgi:two-component system LytT family sensor kinase
MWLLLVFIVLAIHIYILHITLHFDWSLAWGDGFYSCIILSLSAWSIVLLIRQYPTTTLIYLYSLVIALLISLAATLVVSETLKWGIITHNTDYKSWVAFTLPIRFLIIWILNSWVATNTALKKNIMVLDARFQQQTDASILLKEAELFKLRQQLQPHFLYNSLNSISALIMISPDKAQEMIGKLSDFLRRSVKRESEDIVPVKEELAYIQSYLDIESVRFGDRLQLQIKKEHIDDATLPPFLLQPILENAIKFGLYGKTGAVSISIQIVLDGPMLTITIVNPYDGDNQPPKGTGFGLEGIQRRLYLLYARSDLLETKKNGQYFTTILKIPQRYVQSNTDRR